MADLGTDIENAMNTIGAVLSGNEVAAAVDLAETVAGIFGWSDTSPAAVKENLAATVPSESQAQSLITAAKGK